MNQEIRLIGRADKIDLPSVGLKNIPAKIDTGADTSAIWASEIGIVDGVLVCVFFGEESPYYTGNKISFKEGEYGLTRVANSFGDHEVRYKVKLPIRIGGKLVRATFTLSDRSKKTYPVLVGRRLLRQKFVVDVSKGDPLLQAEKEKKRKLHNELDGFQK